MDMSKVSCGGGRGQRAEATSHGEDDHVRKMVTVRTRDTDRDGRTVAEVTLRDGRSLNREMVREGLAWWYRKYAPSERELAR